jgi:hypothetical protein
VETEPVDAEPELLVDDPVRLLPHRDDGGEGTDDVPRAALSVPRWWWAVALLLVLSSGVVAFDSSARAREGAQVSACQTRLRLATGYAERRLGLVDNYLQPTLATDGKVQELHLADLMSARAHRVLPRVQGADQFCRGVSVQPWHFSLAARQSASTAYSAALVTFVQLVAAQGRLPFAADATMQRLRDQVGIDGG